MYIARHCHEMIQSQASQLGCEAHLDRHATNASVIKLSLTGQLANILKLHNRITAACEALRLAQAAAQLTAETITFAAILDTGSLLRFAQTVIEVTVCHMIGCSQCLPG